MDRTVQALPALLTTLAKQPPPACGVLSVYLDVTPARLEGQAYLLSFRDGCRALRSTTQPDQRAALDAALTQVERYLTGEFVPGKPGLALFASGESDYFYVVPLPAQIEDEISWDSRPDLAPLHALLDAYERLAVVLFDAKRARIFSISLGEIDDVVEFEDAVPGRQATGGWFALAQTRYARHREQRLLHHARRTTAALLALLRQRPFDHLFLAGPDEAVALLSHELPRPLRARLAGRLSLEEFASGTEIVQAALAAAEGLERQEAEAAIQELVDEAGMGRATLGPAATLDALAGGRVRHLFVAEDFARPGWACGSCHRLTVTGGRCSGCGTVLTAVTDLRERVMEQAEAQGAGVTVVPATASRLLLQMEGLGARLWY